LSEMLWPLNRNNKFANDDAPFLFSPHLPIGDRYTLTKTHCEGRAYCDSCHHSQAVQDLASFEKGCRRASINVRLPPADIENSERCKEKEKTLYYDYRRVLKVVHLIRNPFDNVVARMHLGVELRRKEPDRVTKILSGKDYEDNDKVNTMLLKRFNDTVDGVLAWCTYVDELFHDARSMVLSESGKFRGEPNEAHAKRNVTIPERLLRRMSIVPCHSEWFRYVQVRQTMLTMARRRLWWFAAMQFLPGVRSWSARLS